MAGEIGMRQRYHALLLGRHWVVQVPISRNRTARRVLAFSRRRLSMVHVLDVKVAGLSGD